jgi:ribosomal protein RSM22 (predicted rRNA methylase)
VFRAVNELWRDSVYEYQCVDVSEKIEMVARSLRTTDDSEGSESEIQNVYFKQYLPISSAVTYDLVVSAYSLSDIPTIVMRKSTVRSLWGKTNRFLVLIEVGNLAGFSILAEARSMLLNSSQAQDAFHESVENSGHVFAPCPHDRQCPMIGGSKPCHFGQRSQLSLIERTSPLRNHGFHIEKFSYLVLQKGPRTETETKSRVLQPVRKRSRHLICTACCPDGEVRNQVVSKGKWRASYKALRSSKWGDRVEITPSQTELDES